MLNQFRQKLSYRLEYHLGLSRYFVYSQRGGNRTEQEYVTENPIQIYPAAKETLFQLSNQKGLDISETFVKKALQKGDRCYLATTNEQPVGYAWLAQNDTLIDQTIVHRVQGHYLYKCFVHPDFRGQRILSQLTQEILQNIRNDEHLYCFIATVNTASQRAFTHAGLEKQGSVTFLNQKTSLRYWTSGDSFSKGCQFYLQDKTETTAL